MRLQHFCTVSQKAPYDFWNNSVKNELIKIIIGVWNSEKISYKMATSSQGMILSLFFTDKFFRCCGQVHELV